MLLIFRMGAYVHVVMFLTDSRMGKTKFLHAQLCTVTSTPQHRAGGCNFQIKSAYVTPVRVSQVKGTLCLSKIDG